MVFEVLSGFTKAVLRHLDDGSYAELQYSLAERPDAGPVIARSGGLRKIRWARSGGVRVIYY